MEELNKSLEMWVTAERPPAKAIHRTVLQIARFLFDFAAFCRAAPDFLRLGIELDSLILFGGGLSDDIRSFIQSNAAPQDRSSRGRVGDIGEDGLNGASADAAGLPTPGAPGITTKAKGSFAVGAAAGDEVAVTKYFDVKKAKEVPQFPTPEMVCSCVFKFLSPARRMIATCP